MAPHQERVVAEKADLDVKLGALYIFIAGPVFADLDPDEQTRLRAQLDAMTDYSKILGARIAAFVVPAIEALNTLHAGTFTQQTVQP